MRPVTGAGQAIALVLAGNQVVQPAQRQPAPTAWVLAPAVQWPTPEGAQAWWRISHSWWGRSIHCYGPTCPTPMAKTTPRGWPHTPHNRGVFSCLAASEPYGSCELLMSLLSHGGAVGGVMALLVQLSGPTPLRALLSGPVQVAMQGAVVQPAAARTSVAASGG